MSSINALWIDTEADFVHSMRNSLSGDFVIHHYPDFDDHTLQTVGLDKIDIVLLEIKLNGKHGLEYVPHLRRMKNGIPIVVVTGHADKDSCIQALNLGVNGMLEKPVQIDSLKEMLSRHGRNINRPLKMCQDRKAIYSQNQWVDLTSTEYKIIETLMTAKRRLTRAELQAQVWPNSSISENNLDTHLTNLKRKIPELSTHLNVKRGLGYFLENQIKSTT